VTVAAALAAPHAQALRGLVTDALPAIATPKRADRPSSRPTLGPRCGGATPDPTRGRTRRPPPPLVKEQFMHSRIGWGQPPTSWGPPQMPGWAPLVDAGPAPLQAARSAGRWLWPTVAVTGFLALTGFVLAHDDPAPGLSRRGLLTIALAAVVVVLLTIHRRYGAWPLARALFEYAVVFLLAVLIATTGLDVDQPPAGAEQASAAADQRPALIKAIDGFGNWLSEWRAWVHKETDRRAQSASAPTPAPPPPSSTRRPPL